MTGVSSILVCRLSALGDVVLTLPVVEALRERFPDSRLEYLSREPFGRVLRSVPAIDALRLWPGPGSPIDEAIGTRRWDLVVDLSVTGRSRRLLRPVRAERRLRASKETLRRFAFVRLRRFGGDRVAIAPAVDRMFSAVEPLGLRRDGRVPRFDVPAPPADGPLLMAPGGGRPTKRWPADRFAVVAARLIEQGRRIRLMGSEAERELVERIAVGLAPEWCDVRIGTDPGELPALAAACSIALTNDSGMLHVAEAAGVPVVALFGPTHPRLGFAPLGPDSRALHTAAPCSPCDPHGPRQCPRGDHRCLVDLEVAQVLDALEAATEGHRRVA